MFPSSNSSSTRDNLHYSQSPLISRCITNNCKRCDAERRAAALPLSGGRVTRSNTAAASHHYLLLCWQQREWDFPGKVCNRRRITLPLTRCTFFGGKPWDGISLQKKSLVNNRLRTKLGIRLLLIFQKSSHGMLKNWASPQHAIPNRLASRQLPSMD